jgi:arylsulfatase A-like enzyme
MHTDEAKRSPEPRRYAGFGTGAAALLLAALAACGDGSAEAVGGPGGVSGAGGVRGVLLVVVDTLRADHLGCYGYPRPTSPNLDRLAAEGARFETAVAASSSTGPSVASILTGRYPRFHGFGYANRGAVLGPEEALLAPLFREAGWRTAAVISNPVLSHRFGFGRGFEHYDYTMHQRELVRSSPERLAAPTTGAALAWLQGLGADERFFLYVHYMDPHGPYWPPGEWRERFATEPGELGPEIPPPPAEGRNEGYRFVPWYQAVMETHHRGEYVARYDGEIGYFDQELGRLLEGLRELGRYADTAILLTSDHGEALGERDFWFCHGHGVTPDQCRVPMVLVHPEIAPGTVVRTPASHVDIFPTLAPLAGGAPSSEAFGTGVSLVELARAPLRRALYCDTGVNLGVHAGGRLLAGRVPGGLEGAAGPEAFEPDVLVPRLDQPFELATVADPPSWLLKAARRYLAAERAPQGSAAELDDVHERALRALGYTGD